MSVEHNGWSVAGADHEIAGDEILQLVKRSPDGLLVLSDSGIIDYANDEAEHLLGTGGVSLRGQTFGFPLAEEGEEEIEVRVPDGTVHTMHIRVTPVTSQGERRWVVALRGRIPSEEPQDAAHDRDDALAVTSHELRGPMAALTGYVDVLAMDWDELSEETRLGHVRRIQRLSRRLQLVVSRFLHSAQLESGLFTPQRTPTRVFELLLEGVAELGEAAAQVDLRIPEDVMVDVHPDHLWSVVSNGILNALRHGAPPVVVTAATRGGWVVVAVVDHGPGVPDGEAERLFERYVRGSHSNAPGTGLGLWITRSIARAYGGEAWYETGDAPGARFCCRLPAVSTAPAPAPEPPRSV